MVRVSTFVFFDIETTGLPYQEKNRTKIIELSFVAVSRNDLRRTKDVLPPICKLSFVLNPHRPIHSKASMITGLDNDMLKYAPTFKGKFNTIKSFLDDLDKPVCLVAHNGNSFDYKILLAECLDANVTLPEDLLCIDSLTGFRRLLNKRAPLDESIVTDDENDESWPDLNITPEELQEIDELSISLGNTSLNNDTKPIKKIVKCVKKARESYKLTDIYGKLFKKEAVNAHRAEGDCVMLLQCVMMCQNIENVSEDFLRWIDNNCKKLNEIPPLCRK